MTAGKTVRKGSESRGAQLSDFRDLHCGETILVCGCGESLNLLHEPQRFVTIGVNDVGRRFTPDYLVVVNPRSQFAGDRFKYVEKSQSKALFTQYGDLGVAHLCVVNFPLGTYSGTDLSNPNVLHFTQNSPYVALCLAAHMGARRIGLIGVDFTENHFFGKTGVHPLARSLSIIDEQYRRLGAALSARGIEVFNLSPNSRLTAFPKLSTDDFAANEKASSAGSYQKRVFFVNYRFLSAGDVFASGLTRAARDLRLEAGGAWWDDPALEQKISQFTPDLIFVVHGRRFVQRWGTTFRRYRTAVWLVDEPYEVDDTASWSDRFDHVFLNDPASLERHRNAGYLPAAFNPEIHYDDERKRDYDVGFVGGYNSVREGNLLALARAGCLSYVVGGPWREAELQKLSLAPNLAPAAVAELYRRTKIIVNVFRELHHYNRGAIAATALNPRIYEALACGAAVVSEPRPELSRIFPDLPVFSNSQELITRVRELSGDREKLEILVARCRARLGNHTYANRLATVLATAFPENRDDWPTGDVVLSYEASDHGKDRLTRVASQMNGHDTGTTPPLFTLPKRNLIYHLWPVKDSLWRWNIEQLLQRIDLFNGRRIVSIFHDERSETPDAVMRLLAGHGCEFVIARNDPRGEAAVFAGLLEDLRRTEENGLTFYAHAKGVKYGSHASRPVKKWAEVLYRVNLDDWLGVKTQLSRFAMTGALKMFGRFTAHRNLEDWHYSGTFFWFRNADVFSREYRSVPDFYGGVEAWPGVMFRAAETGCAFLNGVRQLGYYESFWRDIGDPELNRWESRRQVISAPHDLEKPPGFEGYEMPRLEQLPDEFAWWLKTILKEKVRTLLTIGAGHGGVEWHVARKFREAGMDIEIDVIDIAEREELPATLDDARSRFGQKIRLIEADSQSPAVRKLLRTHYDAVFIDSDHSFRGVSNDFELALSLSPTNIGLHDIVDSDWHISARCCVSRLWEHLRQRYQTDERQTSDWGGIGIVWPQEKPDFFAADNSCVNLADHRISL